MHRCQHQVRRRSLIVLFLNKLRLFEFSLCSTVIIFSKNVSVNLFIYLQPSSRVLDPNYFINIIFNVYGFSSSQIVNNQCLRFHAAYKRCTSELYSVLPNILFVIRTKPYSKACQDFSVTYILKYCISMRELRRLELN